MASWAVVMSPDTLILVESESSKPIATVSPPIREISPFTWMLTPSESTAIIPAANGSSMLIFPVTIVSFQAPKR